MKRNKWSQTLTIVLVLVLALTRCGAVKNKENQILTSQTDSTEIASSVNKSLNKPATDMHIIKANYTDKHEVVNILQNAVNKGASLDTQNQHVENIHDMLGTDRVFD